MKFYKEMMMMVLMIIDFDNYPCENCECYSEMMLMIVRNVHNADDGCIP